MPKLLVVSDEPIARTALKHWLESAEMSVVGAVDGKEAIHLRKFSPEVVVFHTAVSLQKAAGLVLAMRSSSPQTRIVVLSRETRPSEVAMVLSAGADAYVLVGSTPTDLLNAIQAAWRGKRYLDPRISDELIELLTQNAGTGASKLMRLSRRERQVLRLRALGYTVKEIASNLSLSPKSVETYQSRLREKLKLKTRSDMVRYALNAGLLNGE
jgi:two-component system response regulator NreC